MWMHYKKTLKICTLKSQHNYYRNANQNYQTQDGYKITAQIESISKSVEKSGAKYISGDYTSGARTVTLEHTTEAPQ